MFFDDLTITQEHTPIVSKDDYYPFGLTFNSYQKAASTAQNFKYNSFEFMNDLDLGLYDYQARYYDPAIGRFIQVDPLADAMSRHSPYNYAFDNPIRFVDPDGMGPNTGDQDKNQQKEDRIKAIKAKQSRIERRRKRAQERIERRDRVIEGFKGIGAIIQLVAMGEYGVAFAGAKGMWDPHQGSDRDTKRTDLIELEKVDEMNEIVTKGSDKSKGRKSKNSKIDEMQNTGKTKKDPRLPDPEGKFESTTDATEKAMNATVPPEEGYKNKGSHPVSGDRRVVNYYDENGQLIKSDTIPNNENKQ